jgi:hypothetical protein
VCFDEGVSREGYVVALGILVSIKFIVTLDQVEGGFGKGGPVRLGEVASIPLDNCPFQFGENVDSCGLVDERSTACVWV